MFKRLKVLLLTLPLLGFSSPEGASILECKKLVYEGVIKCPTHYYLVEPIKLMPILIKHRKELNLTEEQKERIKHLIREIKERAISLDREIDYYSREVRKLMLEDGKGYEVKSALKALALLKMKRSFLNYMCIRGLRKILTEEQFKKLIQLAGYNNM